MSNRGSLGVRCYYKHCAKHFQNKANLLTHINSIHLSIELVRCPSCEEILASSEGLVSHISALHQPKFGFNAFREGGEELCQSEKFFSEPNILQLPVLPLIEAERSVEAFSYKLPMNVKLYDLLCGAADDEI
jgi:uncharacterized C2H2 Zn-finger protein